MGDSISAINDDYDEYEELCKKLGEPSVGLYSDDSFYDHWRELKEKTKDKKLSVLEKFTTHYTKGGYLLYRGNVNLSAEETKEVMQYIESLQKKLRLARDQADSARSLLKTSLHAIERLEELL